MVRNVKCAEAYGRTLFSTLSAYRKEYEVSEIRRWKIQTECYAILNRSSPKFGGTNFITRFDGTRQ